jgi:MFS transporter, SP family, solute carrier family 2 (myo-inositol transporter), member 13
MGQNVSAMQSTGTARNRAVYNRLLLLVAGLGGLLYGIDVGIISGALPYLTATSGFTPSQLSFVVAAVMLGGVISTLFAGLLSDWMGRKSLMILTALMFCVSIPIIALSNGFGALVLGRLLQGISGGLIGVVVPLYLAECLSARDRGKGTGMFQWLLTIGFIVSALITLYFSHGLADVMQHGTAAQIFAFKDHAWRGTFWLSLPAGILFAIGGLMLSESPRWLLRHGKADAALAALRRSRDDDQANAELAEMQETAAAERARAAGGAQIKESLLKRKYVIPFIIACVILAFNQLTGINSIIGYNTTILLQAGLTDYQAHAGSFVFFIVNFLMTLVAVILVDRKGRKFLLTLGTAGIILSLIGTGLLFHRTEARHVDVAGALQQKVVPNQTLTLAFNQTVADKLLATVGKSSQGVPQSLTVIYSYGGFSSSTNTVRSDDTTVPPVKIDRSFLPSSKVQAILTSFNTGSLTAAQTAPLRIEEAFITPVPSQGNGWAVAITLYLFMAFYAVGPGVCVWLAMSELLPTRIRSNGMSIALFLNSVTQTAIAAVFLPTVGKYGYASMFFAFAAFTVVYFVTAAFFLPETKGKTLEEIEEHFEGADAIRAAAKTPVT